MRFYRENLAKILNSSQNCRSISGHRLYCPVSFSWLRDSFAPSFRLNLLLVSPALRIWVPLLNDQRPWSFSPFPSGLAVSRRHSSLFGLRTRIERQRKIFQTVWRCAKMLKTYLSLTLAATHNTHPHTHTHIYIYIYIYMNAHYHSTHIQFFILAKL